MMTMYHSNEGASISTGPLWGVMDANGASTSATVRYTTNGGFEGEIEVAPKRSAKSKRKISAKLYMKFMKSKLRKVDQKKMKSRLDRLAMLIGATEEIKQKALYEELCAEAVGIIKESELLSVGINKSIHQDTVHKFMDMVEDRVVKYSTLERFPRVIPKGVRSEIRRIQRAGVFQELWILYIDHTDTELKTNKDKILEKDPILFGKLRPNEETLYYITDWVDEYCDLSFAAMVETIQEDDPEFKSDIIPEIDEQRWNKIVREVLVRQERLANTTASNYRALARAEDKPPTKKWWQFWR